MRVGVDVLVTVGVGVDVLVGVLLCLGVLDRVGVGVIVFVFEGVKEIVGVIVGVFDGGGVFVGVGVLVTGGGINVSVPHKLTSELFASHPLTGSELKDIFTTHPAILEARPNISGCVDATDMDTIISPALAYEGTHANLVRISAPLISYEYCIDGADILYDPNVTLRPKAAR